MTDGRGRKGKKGEGEVNGEGRRWKKRVRKGRRVSGLARTGNVEASVGYGKWRERAANVAGGSNRLAYNLNAERTDGQRKDGAMDGRTRTKAN